MHRWRWQNRSHYFAPTKRPSCQARHRPNRPVPIPDSPVAHIAHRPSGSAKTLPAPFNNTCALNSFCQRKSGFILSCCTSKTEQPNKRAASAGCGVMTVSALRALNILSKRGFLASKFKHRHRRLMARKIDKRRRQRASALAPVPKPTPTAKQSQPSQILANGAFVNCLHITSGASGSKAGVSAATLSA